MTTPQVLITGSAQATVQITGGNPVVVEVSAPLSPSVIEVSVPGPQGPRGNPGIQGPHGVVSSLDSILDVDVGGKIDRSLLYFDAGTATFKADATVTTSTLTDGGNF